MRGIDWERMWVPQVNLLEVFIRASLVYLVAHLALRLAGRKELARYSSFNVAVLFLVTIALRQSITVDDASLTGAFLALATLVGWDVLFSWATFKNRRVESLLKGEPRKLVDRGRPLPEAMAAERVNLEELRARLRLLGVDDLGRVKEAFLETDGKVSFVLESKGPPASSAPLESSS